MGETGEESHAAGQTTSYVIGNDTITIPYGRVLSEKASETLDKTDSQLADCLSLIYYHQKIYHDEMVLVMRGNEQLSQGNYGVGRKSVPDKRELLLTRRAYGEKVERCSACQNLVIERNVNTRGWDLVVYKNVNEIVITALPPNIRACILATVPRISHEAAEGAAQSAGFAINFEKTGATASSVQR